MGMPVTGRTWTPEEVRELQSEHAWPRYELVDGELLVTSAPSVPHQRFLAALFKLLIDYTEVHGMGETLTSPADIALDAKSVLQPDIFVIPPGLAVNSWRDVSGLLLAVEILSPSTARHDRVTKRQYFMRHGVPEYWIADLDAAVIERWLPHEFRPEVLSDEMTWQPSSVVPALTLDLPALFARATRQS